MSEKKRVAFKRGSSRGERRGKKTWRKELAVRNSGEEWRAFFFRKRVIESGKERGDLGIRGRKGKVLSGHCSGKPSVKKKRRKRTCWLPL